MLHLHFANRYETLAAALLDRLDGTRSDVFAADTVIVPSAALERALTLAIADRHGICANVEFAFLAQWLWRQIGRVVPAVGAQSPFAADALAWRVYAALGDPGFVADHPRLSAWLAVADEVMRYELACRIAALFEQYVTYRPDWLAAWLQGRGTDAGADRGPTAREDERWQAALWRRLTAELGVDALHPATAFIAALQRGGPAAAARAGLPATAHVFALPALPPLHLDLLQHLGRCIEVHVYVLNPCREYWFELVDRRRLAHLALRGAAHGHEEGNRLLAAWGRQTQSSVERLVEACGDAADDDGRYEPHPASTLLARVHNAILDLVELEPGSVALAPDDRSIELHVCHSPTRELEILQDHLLALFAAAAAGGAALQPSDIVVVTPDLEAAAPLIDAVFGSVPRERYIAYTVSGRKRSRVNAPARALLELLALLGSRFAASAVYGLLQQPIVGRRFGLDDTALQQVHDGLRDAGLRWALDAGHRASFGVPAEPRHSLADALDRLFLGYALPSPDDGVAAAAVPWALGAPPFDAQTPSGVAVGTLSPAGAAVDALLPAGAAEGSQALALGALWCYADALQRLHLAASVPQAPAAWAALLIDATHDFLRPADDELDDWRELQDAIRELAETMQRGGIGSAAAAVDASDAAAPAQTQRLPLAVVRSALEQALDDPARGGVPGGGITFAAMSSLRSLPCEVVCAIGLNDGAFPTAQRPAEFDLIALRPRRGDRQRRNDERNLFLDLLLAARRSLYLSHTGRSVRDNAALPPSVLVSELLDVLVPAIADDPADADALVRARRRLVVEHPLQPFASEGFTAGGDARLRSFNRELGQALRRSLQALPEPPAELPGSDLEIDHSAGHGSDPDDAGDADDVTDSDDEAAFEPLQPFFRAPLAAPGAPWHEVSLAQLVEFFRQPCRYLLRRRLGIDLQRDTDELQDDEPFLPDWPGRNALARRLLPPLLQGADADSVRRLALAGTELPGGALGRLLIEQELDSLHRFAERVRVATLEPCRPPHHARFEFDLGDADPWHLDVALADLRPCGLVRWRYDETRATDVVEAWLHHLALVADAPADVAARTLWLSSGGGFTLDAPDDARALLHDLLRLYRRGLSEPLHFFPKSAWQYVRAGQQLGKAAALWRSSPHRPHGEDSDPAYRLALRGQADPLDAGFVACAETVFAPLLRCFVEAPT